MVWSGRNVGHYTVTDCSRVGTRSHTLLERNLGKIPLFVVTILGGSVEVRLGLCVIRRYGGRVGCHIDCLYVARSVILTLTA